MKKLWIFLTVFIILLAISYSTNFDDVDKPILFGINLEESGLFFAAFLIGLVDGFNPCAMWVLIYLITMASQMENKRRMWIIVSIFLLTSGVLYFMILMGWTGLFKLVAVRPVMIIIGLFAMGAGVHQLYHFYKSGGQVVCEVGDMKSRKKTMSRIDKIIHSKLTFISILATIGLAFIINAIEFACSVGLPMIYAGLLSAADLSLMSIIFYNLVYTFAFMLDDLIIFSVALFALQSVDLDKYSGYSKLIGGIIMVLIGIILLFFPGLLR